LINTPKQKSIFFILKKYDLEQDHSIQVKNLALLLFDKTKGSLHDFSQNERDLVEAGALLHDIGYYISAKDHHKKSAEIIKKERPSGFSDEEINIMANIARYHKGKKPKEKHSDYATLSDDKKELTRKLSSFVRLADALDRSHLSVIKDLDCVFDYFSQNLYIILKLNIQDCFQELAKSNQKKDLFEQEFGVEVKIKVE